MRTRDFKFLRLRRARRYDLTMKITGINVAAVLAGQFPQLEIIKLDNVRWINRTEEAIAAAVLLQLTMGLRERSDNPTCVVADWEGNQWITWAQPKMLFAKAMYV